MKDFPHTEIEQWLASPIANSVNDAQKITESHISNIMKALSESPDQKPLLGPLLGKLKALQKRFIALEKKAWVDIKAGQIAVGHRPSAKLMTDLRLQGTTHILTLLSETEGALDTKKLSNKEQLDWLWFPMQSANAPDTERMKELKELFDNMREVLNKKAKIYIHCSAGIHRTGMITYTFLRYLDLTPEQVDQKLLELRQDTAEGVGTHRKNWGEEMLKNL